MNTEELRKLAAHTRSMREMGIALIGASLLLALFLLIPKTPNEPLPALPATVVLAAPDAFANVPLEAKAAVVYDLATGQTLYAKNADAQLPLASLTKLLTVYAALATLSLETPITIPLEATRAEAPRAFNEGQVFPLADLARLTLTASLNDGAVAIVSAAAARMNRSPDEALASAAAALALSQTYAVNGSGLDVSAAVSGGYGSAYDLARPAGALVGNAPAVAAATTFDVAQA